MGENGGMDGWSLLKEHRLENSTPPPPLVLVVLTKGRFHEKKVAVLLDFVQMTSNE